MPWRALNSESERDLIYGSWEPVALLLAVGFKSRPGVPRHSVGGYNSLICSALSISPHLQITDLKFASLGKSLPSAAV